MWGPNQNSAGWGNGGWNGANQDGWNGGGWNGGWNGGWDNQGCQGLWGGNGGWNGDWGNGPNNFQPMRQQTYQPGFCGPGYGPQSGYAPPVGYNNFGPMNYGFSIPDNFDYKEKLFTSGKDMKLQVNGSQFGFIDHKAFSYGKNFQLLDNNKNVIARCKQEHFTFGRDFRVFDGNGNFIGSLDNEALKSAVSVYTKYTIKDAYGQHIAKLQQFQFINSSVKVRDMNGQVIAEFKQKFNIAKDNWTAHFYGNNIDRRLLVFFPAIFSERDDIID